jgi:hypothetical protein
LEGHTEKSSNQGTLDGSTTIAFENEDIKAIFHRGSSDFLVVTFGDLLSPANGKSFFADSVMQKKDLNCLGFMSKHPNWYPEQSMQLAISSIASVLLKFPKVITYGGSMGGYAAIKYSALLNASAVLALCPQWTIDPTECDGMNPGYRSFFKESMKGMGIKQKDISGKVFLFYDPGHKEDAYHGSRIRTIYKNCCYIPMRSIEHHVTRVLAGSENLNLLIRSALIDDQGNISSIASKLRRSSARRSKTVLFKSVTKHPLLLHKITFESKNLTFLNTTEIESIYSSLLDRLIKLNRHNESIECIERLVELELCEGRKTLLLAVKSSLQKKSEKDLAVLSHHGSMLAYNIASGCLTQAPSPVLPSSDILLKPITISRNGATEQLSINVEGKIKYLLLGSDEKTIIVDSVIATTCKEKAFIVKRLSSKNRFNICIGDRFVTCEPLGPIKYDRTEAKGWEEFSLLNTPA